MKEFIIVGLSVFYIFIALVVDDKIVLADSQEVYNELLKYKEENDMSAIDARCDKVWFKVPGIKGKSLNIKKNLAEGKSLEENNLVFEIVEPKVKSSDLSCGPIYKGNEEKEAVSLIINVAWGDEYVEPMLDILKEKKVKVNFFIEGVFAKEHPELVYKIYHEGHLIGNHSYNHPNFSKLTVKEIKRQIVTTNNILSNIILDDIEYFGPPSGAYDQRVVEVASQFKMETVIWSLDTIDWQKPSQEVIIDRIIPRLHNGAIILMHPTDNTALALSEMIDKILVNYDIELLSSIIV